MSQENVEIVRRAWEVDWDLAMAFLDTNIEWVVAKERPDARILIGHAAVAEYRREWEAMMPGLHFEPDRLLDAGNRVVGIGAVGGKGAESGADVRVALAIVYTLRGGRIARAEEYLNPQEALEAVGLAE